ncbi:hypothetical protein [Arsenophonus nasoniae]|uniref:Phage derepression protein n=2 Tax=Arsenophonus nasoniae TaxID=638 RepID=D2TVH1_9GAMM|nr:phage derepression protein [Arsenophonus nasoniae]
MRGLLHLATQISLSDESDFKLIRAREVTSSLCKHIQSYNLEHEPMPWLGEVLSYVSEDIACVVEEISEKR